MGRAHVDLKPVNIQIKDWEDVSRLHITVLDLGSSLKQGTGNPSMPPPPSPSLQIAVCGYFAT